MNQAFMQTILPVFGREGTWIQKSVLVVTASMVLTLSAKLSIPFYPVPMTMQTFALFVIGMGLGWRMGCASVLLYLAQGALGLPVFAGTPEKGIGLMYMMGPTGGYLFGFILAVIFVGWMAERGWDRNFMKTWAILMGANVLIYISGVAWLGNIFGWGQPILEWGLYPFLIGDVLKILLAATVMPLAWRFVPTQKVRT